MGRTGTARDACSATAGCAHQLAAATCPLGAGNRFSVCDRLPGAHATSTRIARCFDIRPSRREDPAIRGLNVMVGSNLRRILVYRDHLLPKSETFVTAQAEALTRFSAYYCGSRLLPDRLPLPADRILTVNGGGVIGKTSEALFKVWGVAPKFIRSARDLQPVLMHAHFGIDAALALPLVRALRVPLVVTFHGYDATVNDDFAKRSFFAHRRFIANRATLQKQGDLFIAVSRFIRDRLIDQGFPAAKTVVHYIGVDTALFQPDDTVKRTRVVLFVGRLVEKKGCSYLIRAMRDVQLQVTDVTLVVIGDGPLRNELEHEAKSSLRRYQFLGMQQPAVVREWMNRATVFSTPSITAASGDAEGFGLVFAEAQAMGLPVVSFASGGVPEAVVHGQTGFLVKERDHRALADSILRLLQDHAQWSAFSSAAFHRVRNHFDLRRNTKELEDLYEQILERTADHSV